MVVKNPKGSLTEWSKIDYMSRKHYATRLFFAHNIITRNIMNCSLNLMNVKMPDWWIRICFKHQIIKY